MARRRGRGGGSSAVPDPVSNPDGLGVGALAEGRLEHGERGTVESLAAGPPNEGPGGGRPQPQPQPQGGGGQPRGGGTPGADAELFAPTQRPGEPINAGVDQAGTVLADDPDAFLRAAYQVFPHPDILRLIEAREF